jgi:diguanylate cyclase (GGDEF)-like protein
MLFCLPRLGTVLAVTLAVLTTTAVWVAPATSAGNKFRQGAPEAGKRQRLDATQHRDAPDLVRSLGLRRGRDRQAPRAGTPPAQPAQPQQPARESKPSHHPQRRAGTTGELLRQLVERLKRRGGNHGRGGGGGKPNTQKPPSPPAEPVTSPPAASPPASSPAAPSPPAASSPIATPAPEKPVTRQPRRTTRRARPIDGVATTPAPATAAVAVATGGAEAVDAQESRPSRARPVRRVGTDVDTRIVTQFIESLPDWVTWALAALAASLLAAMAAFTRERWVRHTAEQVALTDPLTGVANRLAFDERLTDEWQRMRRYGRRFSVLMIDLDDFKRINDSRGHSTGDRVLKVVARQLEQRVRETDFVARIGGDEFAVICPETSAPGAQVLSDALRTQVTGPEDAPVGTSVGVAAGDASDAEPRAVLDRADAAMYELKRTHHVLDR